MWQAIRESRARRIFNDKLAYKWPPGKLVSLGKMSINGCPWAVYQDIENPEGKTIDSEVNYYKAQNGSAKHREFQDELKILTTPWLKLFPAPAIDKVHPKALERITKYGREYEGSIEFPIYLDKYEIYGYIDAILEETSKVGIPIPIDIKTKHFQPKIFADQVKKELLLSEKDFTQMAGYLWYLTENPQIFGAKPQKGGLCYYNTTQVGDIDAEQEYYISYSPGLHQIMTRLLDTHLKEATMKAQGKESQCDWEYCFEHNKKMIEIREYLL